MRTDMNLEQKHGVTAMTQDVLTHHLNCFGAGDLAGTMADYTAESSFFTPDGLLRGPEAIRRFFVRLFEEFAKPGTSFEMLRQDVDGDTAYIVWKAETADNRFELGTDTFIVQNGKIVTQTFAGRSRRNSDPLPRPALILVHRRRGRVSPFDERKENMTTIKEKNMGKLEGKIALITGGNSGIGLATAKQFVNEGAYVFVTGRREPELAAAVKEVGRNVTGVQGDVSSLGDLDRLFARIKREKGKLDSVFANAGAAKYATFGTITEEHYDSLFNINVKGLLFTVQKALPLLPDGASVILNASVVASKGLPANSVYSATKAAVRSFARTWTTDLKDRRIRVNAVSPGSTDTPGLENLLASSETGQQRKKMISNSVPLGRLGTPDEIAKAVVFLASDDSSYISGTELFVDGGFAQV